MGLGSIQWVEPLVSLNRGRAVGGQLGTAANADLCVWQGQVGRNPACPLAPTPAPRDGSSASTYPEAAEPSGRCPQRPPLAQGLCRTFWKPPPGATTCPGSRRIFQKLLRAPRRMSF